MVSFHIPGFPKIASVLAPVISGMALLLPLEPGELAPTPSPLFGRQFGNPSARYMIRQSQVTNLKNVSYELHLHRTKDSDLQYSPRANVPYSVNVPFC